jgi:GDP-L-fucose synthase
MKHTDTIYVAGHRGLAGSAIWRHLEKVTEVSPDVIIDAAAKVGGIHANDTYPAEFLSENLRIQVNLMDAANAAGVDRLLFLGSSCIYPKFAPQPIHESSLLTGALEETNSAYGIAKIAGILQVQAVRKQFGRHWISAMPTNLYGPNDNYHPENSHVLAALIRKFHEAKVSNTAEVTIWGTGTPLREFLHVDDLASAVEFLLNHYDQPETINVGSGDEVLVSELAALIAEVVGYEGSITHDLSKPDGTPRKILDSGKLHDLGWKPAWNLRDGIADAYAWFVEHPDSLRSV